MSKNILLVPVDFSPITHSVVAAAVKIAQPLGARIVLQHSFQTPLLTDEYGVELGALQDVIAANRKIAQRQLDHLRDRLSENGIPTDGVMSEGVIAGDILAQARKLKPAFIVIGSHGHSRIYNLLVGSTTQEILKKATCPVVVVPSGVGARKAAKKTAKKKSRSKL